MVPVQPAGGAPYVELMCCRRRRPPPAAPPGRAAPRSAACGAAGCGGRVAVGARRSRALRRRGAGAPGARALRAGGGAPVRRPGVPGGPGGRAQLRARALRAPDRISLTDPDARPAPRRGRIVGQRRRRGSSHSVPPVTNVGQTRSHRVRWRGARGGGARGRAGRAGPAARGGGYAVAADRPHSDGRACSSNFGSRLDFSKRSGVIRPRGCLLQPQWVLRLD